MKHSIRIWLGLSMALVAVAGLLVGGCGQSTVTVSGQVFVVTKGRDNIKLALVEVAAIPEKAFEEHVKATESPRHAHIASLESQLKSAKLQADAGRAMLDVIELEVKYRTRSTDVDKLLKDVREIQQKIDAYEQVKRDIAYARGPGFYFKDLPSSPVAVAKTDADGKFSLSVPSGKYIIAAKSSRMSGKDTEHYHWLVRVDGTVAQQSLMLSNDNQVETACKDCVLLPKG